MNNLGWFIFLADLSGNMKCFLEILFFICIGGIAALCFVMFLSMTTYSSYNRSDRVKVKIIKKYIRLCVLLAPCFGLLSLAFPSTKTLAAMYVLPKIANNQDIQHTVNDNLKSLRMLSEKWLIELIRGNDKKVDK